MHRQGIPIFPYYEVLGDIYNKKCFHRQFLPFHMRVAPTPLPMSRTNVKYKSNIKLLYTSSTFTIFKAAQPYS